VGKILHQNAGVITSEGGF